MRQIYVPSENARTAFFYSILASAYPIALSFSFITDFLEGSNSYAVVGLLMVLLFPLSITLMLLIPAVQMRSRLLTILAILFGPLLLLVDSSLGDAYMIDSREPSALPLLVPGGMMQMNPGGPIEYLVPQLAIYIFLVTMALARLYWKTRIFGLPYWLRVPLGGAVLLVILHFEIMLTTVHWTDGDLTSSHHFHTRFLIGAFSWLLATGLYWTFVLGVRPTEIKAKPMVTATSLP